MAESNAKLDTQYDKFNKGIRLFLMEQQWCGLYIVLNESLDQFILLIFYGTFPGGDLTEFGSPFGGGKISLNPYLPLVMEMAEGFMSLDYAWLSLNYIQKRCLFRLRKSKRLWCERK